MTGRRANTDIPGNVRALLGPEFKLRITATAKLDERIEYAYAQREMLRDAIETLADVMREEGIHIEYIVGQPRSPDSLRASLEGLAQAFPSEGVANDAV